MSDVPIETKSRVTIFIKDLGIVLDEAARLANRNGDVADRDYCVAPMARLALDTFTKGVDMGLGDGDDSQLWKVYAAMINAPANEAGEGHGKGERGEKSDEQLIEEQSEETVFAADKVVEVGRDPFHHVQLANKYTR